MPAEKFQQYQTQKIMTASPAMLVFMLYEKAIGCLKEAVNAIQTGEIESRWKANKRAMEIIEHMQMTLDTEAGGEIAANLNGIYGYLLRELPKVDLKNDPAPAERGIKLLEPLCESWRQIADQGEDAAKLAAQAARSTAAGLKSSEVNPSSQKTPSSSGGPTHPAKSSGNAPASAPVGITISA